MIAPQSLHGLQVPTTAILTNSMRYMLYRCYPTQYMLYCCLPVRVEDKERVIRGRALPLHRADITLSFSHQAAFGIPPLHAGLADIKLLTPGLRHTRWPRGVAGSSAHFLLAPASSEFELLILLLPEAAVTILDLHSTHAPAHCCCSSQA
jgi:hypothetical protein